MAKSSFVLMLILAMLLSFILENGRCQQPPCSNTQALNPLTNLCEGTCPAGSYWWNAPNGQNCWPIGPIYGNCLYAWRSPNGSNLQCTQCGYGSYLSSTEFPVCIGGCPPGCSSCNGDVCTGCTTGFYLYASSQCVSSCPNQTIASGSTCLQCPSNCETCISGYICTACQDGYLLLSHGYVKYIDAYSCVAETASTNPCPAGYTYGHYQVPNGTIIYGSDGSSACIPNGASGLVADPNPNPILLLAAKNRKRFNLRQE